MSTRSLRGWTALGLLAVLAVATLGLAPIARSATDTAGPKVEGTNGGIHGFPWQIGCCYFDPGGIGYHMQEFFISGTAKTYTKAATTAPYKTRILVMAPNDPARFNGTVLVEWENVTAQAPAEADMTWLNYYMLRKGYAYVAVSAQKAGDDFLQKWDPVRYGSLSHPGDDYSFDIFTQAGEAVRDPAVLGSYPANHRVKRLIASGQSQSAGRLNTYLSGTNLTTIPQNDANVFDAVLVHADGGLQKKFTDLKVPMIQFESEDSIKAVAPDAGNDPDLYRLWEVVGTSHVDGDQVGNPAARILVASDTVGTQISWEQNVAYWSNKPYGQEGPSASVECGPPGGNEMPQHYAMDAALKALNDKLTVGTDLPLAPRAQFDASGTLMKDAHGNAMGGLRLPPMQVPVATYNATLCGLLGNTVPFTPDVLTTLYPTHQNYVDQITAWTNDLRAKRLMVDEDADEMIHKATASAIPMWLPQAPTVP